MDRYKLDGQLCRQLFKIEKKALILGHIDHIQCDDRGQAQLEHLADEIEIAFQVAGIDDAQDDIDRRHVALPSEKHLDSHHLVG